MKICNNDLLALKIEDNCPNECSDKGSCRNQ